MKPRARWVRQSSQWRNLSTPPPSPHPSKKKTLFFPPTTSAGLLCLACLCYLSSSLRTWTTSRLCLCKSAVAPFALHVASLGQMQKKQGKRRAGSDFPAAGAALRYLRLLHISWPRTRFVCSSRVCCSEKGENCQKPNEKARIKNGFVYGPDRVSQRRPRHKRQFPVVAFLFN